MSEISDMIQRLCPDGVEYRKIKDVVKSISTGLNPRKNFKLNTSDSNNYYVTVKEFTSGKIVFNDKTDRISDEAVAIIQNRSKLEYNDILLSGIGTIGKVALVNIPVGNWNCSESVFLLKPIVDIIQPKFLVYILQGNEVQNVWINECVGSTLKGIRKTTLENLEIPLPPLEVQRKIVEILDNFSELTAELTAELEARRKQYEYYRDNLLNFNRGGQNVSDVKWMKLGEVMTIVRGASPRPIQQYLTSDKKGIHWIKIGDVNPNSKYIEKTEEFITIEGANKSRYLEKGSFVLSNSMSFGRPYILSISGCIHDGWISMVHYEQYFNQDFLYHLLRSDMIQKYWKMKASSGTVSNLNADIVRSTVVPIPSIEQQIEIASVLDKLSSLTTDLTSGLPAEIKARQQQYEYYRDQLLTFKRAN